MVNVIDDIAFIDSSLLMPCYMDLVKPTCPGNTDIDTIRKIN